MEFLCLAMKEGYSLCDVMVNCGHAVQLIHITSVKFDHEIISAIVLHLRLVREGQLSVTGKSMCTSTYFSLEDYVCPGKV